MMTPVELLDDHQRRPRNLGKLMQASAVGDIGSIVAGDALRFYVSIDDGRITQARFQVFNCQGQLAATSALTELAIGRTLADAYALDAAALAVHLGGLDPQYLPPQLWGLEGLRGAIDVFEGREPDFDRETPPLLCRCHGISEDTVRQAIAVAGPGATVEQLGIATKAGTGCGSCQVDLRRLLERKDEPKPAPAAGSSTATPGRIAQLRRIGLIIAERYPGIEPWDLEGQVVLVKVNAAAGDDAARREALARLEAALREQIAPELGVRVV